MPSDPVGTWGLGPVARWEHRPGERPTALPTARGSRLNTRSRVAAVCIVAANAGQLTVASTGLPQQAGQQLLAEVAPAAAAMVGTPMGSAWMGAAPCCLRVGGMCRSCALPWRARGGGATAGWGGPRIVEWLGIQSIE